jgi:hypothetical protein
MKHGKKMYKTAPKKQARQTLDPKIIPDVKMAKLQKTRPVRPGKV